MTIADLEFSGMYGWSHPKDILEHVLSIMTSKRKTTSFFLVLQKAHVTKKEMTPIFKTKNHTPTHGGFAFCYAGRVVGQFSEQKTRAWWWAVLLRTVWIALLSPSVAVTKIEWQISHQKTKRHLKENDGLGPGNPPPNKKTVAPKKSSVFWWEICWENLIEKNWLSHPSEVKFFQTEKGSKWRPSEWFTTGWRRKSLNMVNLLVQPFT